MDFWQEANANIDQSKVEIKLPALSPKARFGYVLQKWVPKISMSMISMIDKKHPKSVFCRALGFSFLTHFHFLQF